MKNIKEFVLDGFAFVFLLAGIYGLWVVLTW